MFDVKKLTETAVKSIYDFAAAHSSETFYACAIDGRTIRTNSVEKFRETLLQIRSEFPTHYQSVEEINALKHNPGDWEYTIVAFAESDDSVEETGFDRVLYDEHYDSSTEEQAISEYRKAMSALLDALHEKNAFKALKLTENFIATVAEHNY